MFEFLIQHQIWILLLVLVVLSTAACAAQYKPHPGALNKVDSAAYDALFVAEAAIDQARIENQTRPLPADAKDALNRLIDAYNLARATWLTYRGAVTTNTGSDPYLKQLTQNLTDLTAALEALQRREVKP
jgi:hypothetical protein